MKLSKEEVKLFYRLYHPLLVYVNKKFKILTGLEAPEDITKFSLDEINKIRKKLYDHPELIDAFVAENPLHFSPEELNIIRNWKNFVKGRFLIFRYLKNYTIFLTVDEEIPKAYGVLALTNTFEEIVGPYLPIMIDAVLLPFNNRIIYDGIFTGYSVIFGGGIRRSFDDAYQQAKLQFGIITSLPFSKEKIEQSDVDKLRFYLRSERNREIYSEEIWKLIHKNEELLTIFHQEMGKIYSRTVARQLHEIGLTNGWFALLEGIPIASGTTRDDVERILQNIVPADKRKFVYIFQLKGKGK